MNKLKSFIVAVCLVVPFSVSADTGFRDGGGGDPNEARVFEIRQAILDWIDRGDARGLEFKNGMTYDRYVALMRPVLAAPPAESAVVVTFVTTQQDQQAIDPEQKVDVDGQPKTCRGFKSARDGRLHIICNSDRFPSESAAAFRQVHHEYAGLVGVEKNDGAASDYEVSNQLSDFGQLVTVYKLGPRRSQIAAGPECVSRFMIYGAEHTGKWVRGPSAILGSSKSRDAHTEGYFYEYQYAVKLRNDGTTLIQMLIGPNTAFGRGVVSPEQTVRGDLWFQNNLDKSEGPCKIGIFAVVCAATEAQANQEIDTFPNGFLQPDYERLPANCGY